MRRGAGLAIVLILVAGGLFAEPLGPVEFKLKGVAFNLALPYLEDLPVPMGADVQASLPLAELDGHPFTAVVRLRGAWEDRRILRDSASGNLIREPLSWSESKGVNRYYSPNLRWALGATQGIVQKDDGNLVEAFAFYRGRYDVYDTSLPTTVFTDMHGIFGSSFLGGLAYDSSFRDSRRVISGTFAELSGEFGPGAINTAPDTDFFRTTLTVKTFMPLFSLGQARDGRLNELSMYLAGLASVDYAGGDNVPIWVMQSFGGRDIRKSLGDCVRGYPAASYDSSFKTVANGEIRLIGPALFGKAWMLPMAYAFVDAGYYSGFAKASVNAQAKGSIMSVGAGLNLDVVDFAYIGGYCGLKYHEGSDIYSTYTDTGSFFWKIQFLIHFQV